MSNVDVEGLIAFQLNEFKKKVVKENICKGQMTLGMFINRLKELIDQESYAIYGLNIGGGSYRGYYEQFFINLGTYDNNYECDIQELYAFCRGSVGMEYYGYKGGEFLMDRETPVWADTTSHARGWAISGIDDYGFVKVILPDIEEDNGTEYNLIDLLRNEK